MDHLTSLNLNRVEVGQLFIPIGTIGPVYVKIGDDAYIPGDQLRHMARGVDISSTCKRRFFIEQHSFDKILKISDIFYQDFFLLTDDEVYLLYANCQRLKGTLQ